MSLILMQTALDLDSRKTLKIKFLVCWSRRQGKAKGEVRIGFGEVEVGHSNVHFWVQSEEKPRGSISEIIYDYFIIWDLAL